jgi:integrase
MTKVTNLNERALLEKPGRHRVADNLFLKVLDSDRAYWVVRYSVDGVSRETSLGSAHKVARADATGRYHAIMADVNKGVDPLAQKRKAKASAAQPTTNPTFGQCCDQYLETHQTDWRSSKHVYQWTMTLTQYAAPIRDIPVDQIKTGDILTVLKPLWLTSPAMAAKFRGRLESVINMAQALGHIDEDRANVARWKGHLDHLLPKRQRLVRGHHKAMAYSDLPAFWTKLAEIDTTASRALMFVILTCARTSEVLRATWDEVSFADAIWRVPASRMKMGKPHDVPLSEQALAILGAQMSGRGKDPFVFPGKPRQPLSSMTLAMLLRRMGVSDVATVHGFRSSARSWMADQGVAFELAESALAHTVGNSVVQAYQRSSMLERRRPLMQSWSDFVTRAPHRAGLTAMDKALPEERSAEGAVNADRRP